MLRRALALLGLSACFALAAAAAGKPAAPANAAVLTAEEIFLQPTLHSARLSPNGHYFGAISVDQSDLGGLFTVDLDHFEQHVLTGAADFEIGNFRWLDDERLVFQMVKEKLYSYGLYVTPADRLKLAYPISSYDGMRIIGVPRQRPDRVLVWILHSASDQFSHSLGLVELSTYTATNGKSTEDLVEHFYSAPRGVGTVLNWHANDDGDLWICTGWLQGRENFHRYIRASESWQPVQLPDDATLVGPDPDERFAWVAVPGKTAAFELRRANLDTGEAGPAVLSEPTYDLGDSELIFSHRTHALVGIEYLKEQPVTVWLSKSYATLQAAVDRQYPGTSNRLVGHDQKERRFLFEISGPQQPGAYVVLDVQTKAIHLISESMPWLQDRPLLPMRAIAYTTRDGVKLEAYLTVPPGVDERHPGPMVVLAHGGPSARDFLSFDPEAQFLASRGYVVLQPNYRGSTGYGPGISDSFDFDFRRMHDDVTDATKTMVRTGLADPKRIAIMGASFGGYLAVAGVTFEDGLYRCAITLDGVFDWEALISAVAENDHARPGEYAILTSRFAKPGRDHDRLMEISPLAHVGQIHAPVLIGHGWEDSIVEVEQSVKLADALKAHGVPHEIMIRHHEGHGFSHYKNRVEFFHRVEAFLAANLGGISLAPAK